MKVVTSEGGVQSLHRALDVLETVATHGGPMAVGEIAARAALPVPTIHRLLRTLVHRGYMRQLPDRRYTLGFGLVSLGSSAASDLGAGTAPLLSALVDALGETANLAVLSIDTAEYIAQAPSPHAMRVFTEVGRRVPLHSTGVGKALIAQLDDQGIIALLGRTGLAPQTEFTLTSQTAVLDEVHRIRRAGYAMDEQEHELGARCVAVAVPGQSGLALSVSGPVSRMSDELVARAVPLLQHAAQDLAQRHVTRTAS